MQSSSNNCETNNCDTKEHRLVLSPFATWMKLKLKLFQRLVLLMFFVGTTLFVNFSLVEINRAGSNPSIGPSLVLSDTVRDIGQTSLREQLQVSFPIHNSGHRRLVLNEFDLECDCVDRARGPILIPAGETAEVNVALDTRFAFGPVENSIRFTTNDPAQPRIVLTVRAIVAEKTRQLAWQPYSY